MAEGLGRLIEQALADVEASRTLSDLDEVRVRLTQAQAPVVRHVVTNIVGGAFKILGCR